MRKEGAGVGSDWSRRELGRAVGTAIFIAVSCLFLTLSPAARAVENHWTGAGGDGLWSNPGNWSLARAPISTDDVFIDLDGTYAVTMDIGRAYVSTFTLGATNGTQTFNITAETGFISYNDICIETNGVMNFDPGGDFLSGSNMTVRGILNWKSGTLSNTGKVTVATGGNLNITASSTKYLFSRLENYGTVNWNSSGAMNTGSGALFENYGLFTVQGWSGYLGCSFLNAGKILEVAGAGAASLGFESFTNTGTIEVQTNAVLNLYGNLTFNDGSMFAGDGVTRLSFMRTPANVNGVITINGIVELATTDDTYATLTGTHTLTGSGVVNWRGGYLSGPGTTTIATNFHFNIIENIPGTWNVPHYLDGHTLENFGTVTWNAPAWQSSGLIGSGNASFANHGLLVVQSRCDIGGSIAFLNTGTILKPAGSGSSWFAASGFTNRGTIEVQTNATLELIGSITSEDGVFSGEGVVRIGDWLTANGAIIVNGTVELSNPGNLRGGT